MAKKRKIGKGRLKAYTAVAALNTSRDVLKHCRRKPADSLDQLEEGELGRNPFESPEGALERRERQRALRHALSRLPTTQRQALVLFYFYGLDCEHIAKHLNIKREAVKSRMHRGYLSLRKTLQPEDF